MFRSINQQIMGSTIFHVLLFGYSLGFFLSYFFYCDAVFYFLDFGSFVVLCLGLFYKKELKVG